MKKIFLVIALVFVLGGCAFFDEKKTTISFGDNENQANEIEKEVEKNEDIVSGDDVKENENGNVETSDNVEEKSKEEESKELPGKVSEKEKKEELEKEITSKFEITDKLVSWGFSKKDKREIDTVIIHSSHNAVGSDEHNLDDIIYKEYKPYGVSSHYIISREGKTYRLVEDKNIAYHAGTSKMPDGRTGVNDFSIGVEIVNTKSEKPNEGQYLALKNLISYIKGKYEIKYVLGHSDIAPGRKDDPWNFDWDEIK